MAKPKRDDDAPPASTWLMTYGDLVTCILAFFVLLFSMSTIDAQKAKAVADAMADQFGTMPGQGTLEEVGVLEPQETTADEPMVGSYENIYPDTEVFSGQEQLNFFSETDRQLEELKRMIDQQTAQAGLQSQVESEIVKGRGLVIRILTDDILFDLGKADLKPSAALFLDLFSEILVNMPNSVIVEGHTDDLPIRPGYIFETNWELSGARASSVVRYLIDSNGFEPNRMTASGYADSRPRFPNDSAEHRAYNRRVEIVVRRISLEEQNMTRDEFEEYFDSLMEELTEGAKGAEQSQEDAEKETAQDIPDSD